MSEKDRGRELGMGREITRRDFLNGVGIAVGSSIIAANSPWLEAFGVPQSPFAPEKDSSYYPPAKTGMRGAHDGSWEVAHDLRDHKPLPNSVDDGESYDLVIVGTESAGLRRPTSSASLPEQRRRFSSSITMTISADMPREMNSRQGSDCCLDTAEPNRLKRRAITAKYRWGC